MFVAASHIFLYVAAIYTLAVLKVIHFNFFILRFYLALRWSFIIHVGLDPKRLQRYKRFTPSFAHLIRLVITDFQLVALPFIEPAFLTVLLEIFELLFDQGREGHGVPQAILAVRVQGLCLERLLDRFLNDRNIDLNVDLLLVALR